MRRSLDDSKKTKRDRIQEPVEGRDRIGKPAPDWDVYGWVRGKSRTVRDLRGTVMLLAFFGTDRSSKINMPVVQSLFEKYSDKGLKVVGFYNLYVIPSYFERNLREKLLMWLARWKIGFPVALDIEKGTLDPYWFDSGPRSSRNVLFLIDRKGIVRYLHPGSEMHPSERTDACNLRPGECNRHFATLESAIQTLFKENR